MAVSYKKLWKMLIDKDMKKKDLCTKAGISTASVTKMGKGGHVTTEVLAKICAAMDCNMIMPLANILKQSGCEITADSEITATGRRIKKKIVIYPAMWVEPHATNTIFVSDAYIKYAKPYAVQKILDNI